MFFDVVLQNAVYINSILNTGKFVWQISNLTEIW